MKITKKKNELIISLNPKIYPLEAIYGTCYIFIDRAYLFLDGNLNKEVKVFLKGKKELSPKELEKLAGEFKNELLNTEELNEIGINCLYTASKLGLL